MLPDKLYKFSPLRESFFYNRLVRLTQKSELNDPYEFHPSSSDIAEYRSIIPSDVNLSNSRIIASHMNGMGVMSFTESVDNLLMWSHYGDEHRGMAVEFDPRSLFFREMLKPVTYSIKRYVGPSISLDKVQPSIRSNLFLEKSSQWAAEKEWRIIDSLITADCLINPETFEEEWQPKRVDLFPWEKPGLYMKQVPAEAILSITFGCRVEESTISRILDILECIPHLNHLKKFRTTLNINEYQLEFVELNGSIS